MKYLFALFIPCQIFCCQDCHVVVDYEQYNHLIDEKLEEVDKCQQNLVDSFDIYTYYWLKGAASGMREARDALEECIID